MRDRNKKNILVVTTSFPTQPGDFAGLFIYDLSKRLAQSFNVVVLAPHCSGAQLKETWSGISIYRFRYFWPIKWQRLCYGSGILTNLKSNKFLLLTLPFLLISQFFKIAYLVKKEKIDLINAHWFMPSGLIAGLVAKIYKKPLVITAHGSDIFVLQGWFWGIVKKLVVSLADNITAVSSEIKKNLEKFQAFKSKRIFITPMGVEASLFKPVLKQELFKGLFRPILLFVGRLSKAKGIDYLIKALPMILEKFPKANLMIVGSGPDKKEMESLVSQLGIKEKVYFLGSLPNTQLADYYQQADVFILPSLTEGTPVSALEAMSSGCPVVASRVGGLPALIEDGKSGLLVKPCSSEEISQAIIRILQDSSLSSNIIKEARKIIEEKYDWPIAANRFKDIYERCL